MTIALSWLPAAVAAAASAAIRLFTAARLLR